MADPSRQKYLVTGSSGCIGAWVVRCLLDQGCQVVGFDLKPNSHRLQLLRIPEKDGSFQQIQGDVGQLDSLLEAAKGHAVTHLIHLAALQVPFCRADPVAGARVNVVGTVNVFEFARRLEIPRLTYASSIAVYGPPEGYPPGLLKDDALFSPRTIYGVFKQANEGTARNYWEEQGIASIALRPHTVYGVGRDQGITSGPTQAMLAAARGMPYEIQFANCVQFQLARDAALQFIEAAQDESPGALAFNLGGEVVSMEQIIRLIRDFVPEAQISHTDALLPFPEGCEARALEKHFGPVHNTSLEAGVRQTIETFRSLIGEGLLDP